MTDRLNFAFSITCEVRRRPSTVALESESGVLSKCSIRCQFSSHPLTVRGETEARVFKAVRDKLCLFSTSREPPRRFWLHCPPPQTGGL